MEEKTTDVQSNVQTERFQFVLSINDFIICQRYFKIGGFKSHALESVDLMDAGNKCVRMIKDDLKAKTQIYYQNSVPQIFEDEEEMHKYLDRERNEGYLSYGPTTFPITTFIIFRKSPNVYVWNGNDVEPYEGRFNRADYIADTTESTLKFEFLVDGKCVYSEVFDGNAYPRFVRNNIDLSNSKNRYRAKESFSFVEAALVDAMNDGRKDLIFPIISELSRVCSYKNNDDYTTKLTGWKNANGVDYSTEISKHNAKWMRKMEILHLKGKSSKKKQQDKANN